MVERESDGFHLVCDGCGNEHEDGPFDTFYDATDAAKASDWSSTILTKHGNKEWINLCPKCQD